MYFSKNSEWQKIQHGGPHGFYGRVVDFDPKNIYTRFRVNRTYGVNFKVKTVFLSI